MNHLLSKTRLIEYLTSGVRMISSHGQGPAATMEFLSLIVSYYPNLPNLYALSKNNLPVLHASNRLKKVFSECPLIVLPPIKEPSGYLGQFRVQASQAPTG